MWKFDLESCQLNLIPNLINLKLVVYNCIKTVKFGRQNIFIEINLDYFTITYFLLHEFFCELEDAGHETSSKNNYCQFYL
jgi:hypothetical protein